MKKGILGLALLGFLFLLLGQLKPDWTAAEREDFALDGGRWCDRTATACERNSKSCNSCSATPDGACIATGCGNGNAWQNGISGDCVGDWAPHKPDGKWRVHKKPNYYGWGVCSDWAYGEPFYARSVKY